MTERIKVLQVLGMSAGGIAAHVARITEELNRSGSFEVDVAAPPDLPGEMPAAVWPLRIPEGPLGHRRAVRAVARRATGGGYRVIHAHGLRAGIDSARAGKRVGIHVVTTVHNLVQPEIAGALKARAYRLAEPLVAKLSDRTLAVSEEIAARLRSAAPSRAESIEVLHLGVGEAPVLTTSRDDVRATIGLMPHDLLVLTIARLSPQKALHVMLDAVGRLPDNVHLAILGEGPLEADLRTMAASAGLSDRVHFLGFRSDVADHLAAADVYALSSIWEGVPLSAQEAILLGVPVVATSVGGMPELIEDGVSGRLVPRDDPKALAAALTQVLDDRGAAERYAAAALVALEVNFSTARMFERLSEIYTELAHET